jgi:hypothetical protein
MTLHRLADLVRVSLGTDIMRTSWQLVSRSQEGTYLKVLHRQNSNLSCKLRLLFLHLIISPVKGSSVRLYGTSKVDPAVS